MPHRLLPYLASISLLAAGDYHLDPDTRITLRQGFDAELLYEVPPSQGSWVAMAFDPKGRLIVSDQDDKGVFRVTLPEEGVAGSAVKVESLKGFPYLPIEWGQRRVGGALGFLYAFDSLYMSSMKGFYRIRDTDGDDTFDEFTLLKALNPGYEHSAHSVIVSEDGKALYLVSGNYTRTPEGTTSLQPPVWQTDSLLTPMPDPMGHAVSILPPGGWVCRISPDGKDWKMISSGFRNPVDLAINREGELFTFDSDLEFDIGSPWYRPTRVCHVTPGSEFGWRSGSAKWPEYFADSMAPVINVGPGSPTGIAFGHHSDFPASYRDKLFVCDWTFGTVYTIEMEESGSSYTGTKKEFLHGAPLNIAAMRFGPDGSMYFTTGGRNTASKLYRIRHTGEKDDAAPRQLAGNQEQRNLRRMSERFHGSNAGGEKAIEKTWPLLSHADRSIRYAARIAIENQDLPLWQEKVFSETDPRSIIYSAIALCRHGEASLSPRIIGKLNAIPYPALAAEDRLALLRAYSLCFIRMGRPEVAQAAAVIAKLEHQYPAQDDTENAELCRVLCYLDSPQVVAKTIALMKSTQTKAAAYDNNMLERHQYGEAILKMMDNAPNTRNIHYAYCLRQVQNGWTSEDRRFYFSWLNDSLGKNGGRSFAGYINAIRSDAITHLPADAAAALSGLLGDIAAVDLGKLPAAKGPPVIWTVGSAMKLFEKDLTGRDYANGKAMFAAGRCIACHRFEGTGGYSGPDLGSVANRFSIRDILVAICEPSQSISEQYQASDVKLKDGGSLYGRIISRSDAEITVATNPFNFRELSKAPMENVKSVSLSQTSMMPVGTIFTMNRDELMDLMAYLISGGNPEHAAFTKE
ncbi:c-type cytochrome [Akkermansiaceae bacterium]|nr:c-type cytochrome [Akkermansiaceae bacterium]